MDVKFLFLLTLNLVVLNQNQGQLVSKYFKFNSNSNYLLEILKLHMVLFKLEMIQANNKLFLKNHTNKSNTIKYYTIIHFLFLRDSFQYYTLLCNIGIYKYKRNLFEFQGKQKFKIFFFFFS